MDGITTSPETERRWATRKNRAPDTAQIHNHSHIALVAYSSTPLTDVYSPPITSQTLGEEQPSPGHPPHSCLSSACQQCSQSSTSSAGQCLPSPSSTSSQWPSTALYGTPSTQVGITETRHYYRRITPVMQLSLEYFPTYSNQCYPL